MTRAVKLRVVAFVVLSAIGISYVAANYLGLTDAILGRGYTVHATLPTSGGLFVGSNVTYRGVGIGEVSGMTATREGVEVDVEIEEDTKLPLDSEIHVHNLSAVGEQYLDFIPPDNSGPYAEEGSTFEGSAESIPVGEGELLVELDDLVDSVDKQKLQVLIRELGDTFTGTEESLQRLLDSGSSFVDAASANTEETIRLLETGLTVLRTQQDQGANIRSLSSDLAELTTALRKSDGDLRTVLDETPGAVRQIDKLMRELEPTLPVLLSNLIGINQTVVSNLAGVEQLLVTFPPVIASGPAGVSEDGFGQVNMQLDYSQPPCTNGYKPPSQWRQGNDLTDAPIFPAECDSGLPYVARGTKNAPGNRDNASPGRSYTGSYDPRTGMVRGAVGPDGGPVRFAQSGDLSILGDDSWKWLLVGPVSGR